MDFKVFKVGVNSEFEYIAATNSTEALNNHLNRAGKGDYERDEVIDVTEVDVENSAIFESETGYEELTWRQWLEGFEYSEPSLLCWND